MKQLILAAIWVLATAIPALNAQQASPSNTTATQQTSKPKVRGIQAFPQPRGQPRQATTASNDPRRDKRIANNPAPGKPPDTNPGHGKPAANSPGNGKTTDNEIGRGKTTNDNGNSYGDAVRPYRHERHDHDWWKQHYIVIVLVGGGYYYWNSGYWYPAWGYDPNYERYDYDGPIYTYGNLLPDRLWRLVIRLPSVVWTGAVLAMMTKGILAITLGVNLRSWVPREVLRYATIRNTANISMARQRPNRSIRGLA